MKTMLVPTNLSPMTQTKLNEQVFLSYTVGGLANELSPSANCLKQMMNLYSSRLR
jgi:hypothetical protein